MSEALPLVVGVGGFLGAGKTTTILRAARRLREQGRRVAIVTNDQASDLVDTALARLASETVAEIPGGCFCCRFDAFEETLAALVRQAQPDVVLAEAVGSCTDLAATVYQPLRQLKHLPVRLGPLSVVVDAARLRDVRPGAGGSVWPATVGYLYHRQLAEADVLLLNKIDQLTAEERSQVQATLATAHPGVPVLALSAATGEGIDGWLEQLVDTPAAGARVLDLDYDRYAAAEAVLGWLNLSGTLAGRALPVAAWIRDLLEAVRRQAVAGGALVGHVKVWLEAVPPEASEASEMQPGGTGTAGGSLITNDQGPHVWTGGDLPRGLTGAARVLVNARVATAPEVLRLWLGEALVRTSEAMAATFTIEGVTALRPARPVPLYRLDPVASPV